MLTTLTTVKARLSILDSDTLYDSLLTTAIKAISARFDKECHRTLARTVGATYEFDAAETDILPTCYPIESVTRFEIKYNESQGWLEQTGVAYLIRRACVISLPSAFSLQPSAFPLARVTYTGGYLLPGSPAPDPPVPVCQDLPGDLEQAAVEQVAYWFQIRDRIGRRITWPSGGIYEQFVAQDLLESVTATLAHYKKYSL